MKRYRIYAKVCSALFEVNPAAAAEAQRSLDASNPQWVFRTRRGARATMQALRQGRDHWVNDYVLVDGRTGVELMRV